MRTLKHLRPLPAELRGLRTGEGHEGLSQATALTISRHLTTAQLRIYRPTELYSLVRENRLTWELPASLSERNVVADLVRKTKLEEILLRANNKYPSIRRYTWGPVSAYAVALSVRPNAYLSHETAACLHGLLSSGSKTIYVNREQSTKHGPPLPLTQEAITRAFASTQRLSRYTLTHGESSIVLLSGKNTNRLEIETIPGSAGEPLPVTSIERTLVDITVRPAYAGGVSNVLRAFRQAKGRISVQRLIKVLKQLGHAYPYHQPIGFYMERAGFPSTDLERLLRIAQKFDFFLAHRLSSKRYSQRWRLYYPKDL